MIGRTISHYTIMEKLGKGGMGEVFLAEDTKLRRKVVLKFLPSEYTSEPELKARFIREAQAAAALNHPNITAIHEINEVGSECSIYMKHVEGKPIKQLLFVTNTSQTDPRYP